MIWLRIIMIGLLSTSAISIFLFQAIEFTNAIVGLYKTK